MIEGIIGLFVILALILVVPYIKDYFNRQTTSYKVFDDHAVRPIAGEIWFDRSKNQTYIYNGEAWQVIEPKEGDMWLW